MYSVSARVPTEMCQRIRRRQIRLFGMGLGLFLVCALLIVSLVAAMVWAARATSELPEDDAPAATETALILPYIPELAEPVALPLEELETFTPSPRRYYLTEEERDMVERVVMAESGGEDYDGQCLVAQCILNTAEARKMTPLEVVQEKNQYASPAAEVSSSVRRAVYAVFDDGYTVTDQPIRWFYAPKYSAGRWHEENLVFALEHGGHKFFKEG